MIFITLDCCDFEVFLSAVLVNLNLSKINFYRASPSFFERLLILTTFVLTAKLRSVFGSCCNLRNLNSKRASWKPSIPMKLPRVCLLLGLVSVTIIFLKLSQSFGTVVLYSRTPLNKMALLKMVLPKIIHGNLTHNEKHLYRRVLAFLTSSLLKKSSTQC